MTHPLRSSLITGPSSLLRGSPPLSGASVLSASRLQPLAPFPWHRRQGSHVLYQNLIELLAAHTPDAARSVSGHLLSLSRRKGRPAVLTSPNQLSTLPKQVRLGAVCGEGVAVFSSRRADRYSSDCRNHAVIVRIQL